MSARYPLDPFALPERPDIPFPTGRKTGFAPVTAAVVLKRCATVILITIGLATAVFIPALVFDISRVETVVIAGQSMTLPAYSARVIDMFLGALVFAIALVSFVLSAMICVSERSEWGRFDQKVARKRSDFPDERTRTIEVLDV